MLGVILGAEKAAPPWGLYGYRLNGGELASPRVAPYRSAERHCGSCKPQQLPQTGTGAAKAARAKSICRVTEGVGS
jgi:hypothetical protein